MPRRKNTQPAVHLRRFIRSVERLLGLLILSLLLYCAACEVVEFTAAQLVAGIHFARAKTLSAIHQVRGIADALLGK